MKRVLALLILIGLLMPLTFPANAAIKAGTSCTKLNSTKTYAGYKYKCIKSGKKLVWGKGVKVLPVKQSVQPSPTATPTPTPIVTASPKPTVTTSSLDRPKFTSSDLKVVQGKIQVNWQGTSYTGYAYPFVSGFDLVGVLYKKSSDAIWLPAGALRQAGSISVSGVVNETYSFKLVAFSNLGNFSQASDEQSIKLTLSGPNEPKNVVRAWVADTFTVSFDQNPYASGNESLLLNRIRLKTTNGAEREFDIPIKQTTRQVFELSQIKGNSYFGPQTSPAYSGEVWSVDIFGEESIHTSFDLLEYVSPLTPPVISAKPLYGGYEVSFSSQPDLIGKSVFNNISIEVSSVGPDSDFQRIASGSLSPLIVSAGLNFKQVWIRAIVYDNSGSYPKEKDGTPRYSNVVSVTPSDTP